MVTREKVPRQLLIDLDHSVAVNPQTGKPVALSPSTKDRTGTIPFMAVDLCHSRSKNNFPGYHLPRYDLESFVWVFVWVMMRPRSPTTTSLPVTKGKDSGAPIPPSVSSRLLPKATLHSQPTLPTVKLHLKEENTAEIGLPRSFDLSVSHPSGVSSSSVNRVETKKSTWWNSTELGTVADLKRGFVAAPDLDVIDPASADLVPLMQSLLGLLDRSYREQSAIDESVRLHPSDRDLEEDHLAYSTPGGVLTAESLIDTFQVFLDSMP